MVGSGHGQHPTGRDRLRLEDTVLSTTRRWSEAGPDGLADGTLELRAYRVPEAVRGEFWGFPYAAGMISTEKSHDALYGYWEVALRVDSLGKGQHFAMWLLPQDNSWPPEIDLLEIVHGDPKGGDAPLTQWFNNAHGSSRGLEVDRVDSPRDWHTVGFEWTAQTMRWLYDGVVVREQPNYVNKPMYFLASWEVGGKWPGDPNDTSPWPAQVELDYVKYFAPKGGASEPGAPAGYTLTWKDDFNTPSIGVEAGKNFAPYFVDWGVRHLAGNEDEAIKVADGELARGGLRTYGEALAATGVYGDRPFFHHYTQPGAVAPAPNPQPPSAPQPGPAPAPAPSPTPTPAPSPTPAPQPAGKAGTVAIVASGEADGGGANNGPHPRFDLLVDGKTVAASIAVTAAKDKGQWQTIEVATGLDLAQAKTIGIKFTNDWANWKPGVGVINGEDRNLWIDKLVIAGKTFEAESGLFRYAGGGTAKTGELLASNGTLEIDVAGKIAGGAPQPGPAPAPSPTPTPAPSPAPAPQPAGKAGTVAIVASGEADGGGANNGPHPRFDLLVDGKTVAASIAVTAAKDKGQWQTIEVATGLDLAQAKTIGIKFTNDWANWKPGVGVINGEDRNLWIDKLVIAGKTFEAESGLFRYAGGGTAKTGELLASNGTLEIDVAGRIGATGTVARAAKGPALDPASILDSGPALPIDGPAFRGHGEANEIAGLGLPFRPDLETLVG